MPETPPIRVDIAALADDLELVRKARQLAAQWKELAENTMARIKDAIGEAEEATIDGKPVVRHSTRTVTRVDSKRLRADLPAEVLAPYLNITTEHRYELEEN
jgi:hypothetical protein